MLRRVRRIAIAVGAGADRPPAYFTFRPTDDGGVVEDDLVAGCPPDGRAPPEPVAAAQLHPHPARGARGRAALPLRVAQDNPADQRLIALAQVRQLGVVRDESGRVTSLPQVERAISNCLEAIRRARAGRGAKGARLDMNHVWLQVWPVIDAEVDQLTAVQNSIAPLTAGAGIEEILRGRPGGRAERVGDADLGAVLLPGRFRGHLERRPAADRAAQADRRLPAEGAAGTPPRDGLPLRDAGSGGRRGRLVGRVRPRRQRTARPCRPTAGTQQGRHHRRRRHDANPRAPGGQFAGSCSAATPPGHSARWRRRSARGSSPRSTSPRSSTSRSSGTPCPPARGSRWTRAPRTWTGSPGR